MRTVDDYRVRIVALIGVALFCPVAGADQRISFSRDIRPILSDNCFRCHGPNADDRQSGLRLDEKQGAFASADSGQVPIVPGSADQSELFRRIATDDEFDRMPPVESGKSLTDQQVKLIRRWIEQGASWGPHWSLVPPSRPPLPSVAASDWCQNEIDYFVLARLEAEGWTPSRPAGNADLLRRVSLDLIGLPPSLEQLSAFLHDETSRAFENAVDRLLESPQFGVHQARFWLDAARYADTHGLHFDNYREIWPYRDWVVNAYNDNLPFDRFLTEQLAGDLLPEASRDQRIATGFNRCHVTTNEGGSILDEVQVRNVVDRVVTTSTVFLGLTLDCTRCHDHKYDPFTMKDFYSLYAFFNSLDADVMDGNAKDHPPVIRLLSAEDEQQLASLQTQQSDLLAKIRAELARIDRQQLGDDGTAELEPREYVWVDDQPPTGSELTGAWNHVHRPEPVFAGETSRVQAAPAVVQHYFTDAARPWVVAEGDVFFTYVLLDRHAPPEQIMLQWNNGAWEHRAYWGANQIGFGTDQPPSRVRIADLPSSDAWVRLEVPAADVGLAPGDRITAWAFTQFGGKVYWDRSGVLTKAAPDVIAGSYAAWLAAQPITNYSSLPPDIAEIARGGQADHTAEQVGRLQDYFITRVWSESRETFDPLLAASASVRMSIQRIHEAAPTTLVYQELAEPKPAFILKRGQYDQRGESVARDTPAALPPFPAGAPPNRLGLARWMLDPAHPLTARVAVNQLWQRVFGTGIVATAEDFGSQGQPPSHPELLDWLAVQFVDDGWDVKRTLKRMVMSSTYQQSAVVRAEIGQRDPGNRLLARSPRWRLDAEVLRDQALLVSGLLDLRLGGPAVRPPQPEGLWKAVGYVGSNTDHFVADTRPDQIHRRSLYTFFKRTAPPPQFSAFDAPTREACVVRRERTNTPLQALLLLNDPQYLEAARALAEKSLCTARASSPPEIAPPEIAPPEIAPPEIIARMWRTCVLRRPTSQQLQPLVALFHAQLERFRSDPVAARATAMLVDHEVTNEVDEPTLAAMTLVASVVLNCDEVLNKN